MNREAQKRGVPDTAKPQPVLSTWPTPQTTVRAILYAISARGVNALNDSATLERLTRCDDAAIAEIDARVSKLRGGRSELAAALRKARGTEPGPSADGRTRREAEPTDAIAIVDASPLEDHVAPQAHNDIIAKPFTWPDPATIPARQFLYGRHYIRKNIGATIGAGGRAKTTLGLTEAIGMASGRDLLGGTAITPLRVWCLKWRGRPGRARPARYRHMPALRHHRGAVRRPPVRPIRPRQADPARDRGERRADTQPCGPSADRAADALPEGRRAYDRPSGVIPFAFRKLECVSAWNKDPVFGVIGIQSGPRG